MRYLSLLTLALVLISSSKANAQLTIKFGDNPQHVISVTSYVVNQTNLSPGEVLAKQKVLYDNGNPTEVIVYKTNLTNFYGTLTYPFSVKERFLFRNNALYKILKEIPEKSVEEVRKFMLKSSEIRKIDGYMFSEDYEHYYTIFLNSNRITTIQSVPTRKQKFPKLVQDKLNNIFKQKDEKLKLELEKEKEYIEKRKAESKKSDDNISVHSNKPTSTISLTSTTKGIDVNDVLADSISFFTYFNKHINKDVLGDFTGMVSFELHFSYGKLDKVTFMHGDAPQDLKDAIEQSFFSVKKYHINIKGFNLEERKNHILSFRVIRKMR